MINNSVAVIGAAGHIGLPLSFLLAKHKYSVTGIDKDQKKIDLINKKKKKINKKRIKKKN